MPITASAPAKRGTPRQSSATRVPVSVSNARLDGVNGIFQLAAAGCVMKGWYPDAAAFAKHGPNVARELVSLGEQQESVGKVIDYLCAAGPYTAIITAILPLALQIAANHNAVSATSVSGFGIVSPKILEESFKAEAELAELRMLSEMQDAKTESDKLKANMDSLQSEAA
jgi:hypothetical protein